MVGGLSGSNYASGTSYLQSPCFDFTTLVNPELSFKIAYQTELGWDGVRLEYSIDQGSNWTALGSTNSNTNCQGLNWYNTTSIRYIGNNNGWSGDIFNGNTSCNNQWMTAKHDISFLAGKSRVIFRFMFGAGTVNNNFDGFAFDDFSIKEIVPSVADFSYVCIGNNQFCFANIPSLCQTSIQWNFGDPLSGSSNNSNQQNPSHTFSGPGVYNVTLTINYSNTTTPSVIVKQVVIIEVDAVVTQPLLCSGNQNGIITANVDNGSTIPFSYSYIWNTNPPQTSQTISNLASGTYSVTVSAPGSCEVSSSVILNPPPPAVNINLNVSNATCGLSNGTIVSTVTGGTAPYIYLWSNGASNASVNNLSSGTFSLTITDANNCIANQNNIVVNNNIIPANVFLGNDTTICEGQTLLLNAGTFSSYLWQDNSTTPTFLVTQTGIYNVSVVNSAGCSGSDEIKVTVECKGVFFPSSFTPNNDGLNDLFGPIGDIGNLRAYSFSVYNRWGQRLFTTNNPYLKWNGTYKSLPLETQSLVWIASYKLNDNNLQFKKGTITLLR